MSEYAHPEVLVETEWLAEHLDDPGLRILEVDEDTTAYEKGHIRGAVGSLEQGEAPTRRFRRTARHARVDEPASSAGEPVLGASAAG